MMTTEATVLHAEFPTAVRGYARSAVDDFVAEIGRRLDTMQARLDSLESANVSLKEQLARSTSDLGAFAAKEAAIASALVTTEQRRVTVEHELELRRAETQAQVDQLIAQANEQAETILEDARRRGDGLATEAEARVATEQERLRALCAEYDETVTRMRRVLEAQLALLPNQGSTLAGLSVSETAVARDLSSREPTEIAA